MIRRIHAIFRPRILIRQQPGIAPEDIARIFAEWQSDCQRLAAIFQVIQEQLDIAQGEVAAHRHDPTKLPADAGACDALEALLASLVSRLQKP